LDDCLKWDLVYESIKEKIYLKKKCIDVCVHRVHPYVYNKYFTFEIFYFDVKKI